MHLLRVVIKQCMGTHFDGFLSKRLAVHPPLGLEHGLNDVAGLTV
jgi:hypothetical protein